MSSRGARRPVYGWGRPAVRERREGAAMAITYDGYLIVLFVSDMGRSRDFYENVMGLECKHADNDAYFQLGPDGLLLIDGATADDLLSPADVDDDPARGARSVLASTVEDVDAAYEELRSRGAEF